jgi:hypothetical protein
MNVSTKTLTTSSRRHGFLFTRLATFLAYNLCGLYTFWHWCIAFSGLDIINVLSFPLSPSTSKSNLVLPLIHNSNMTTLLQSIFYLCGGKCYNHNIGFVTKCEVQGPMRPRVCLGVKHTFTNGENAKDETQWLPNAFSFWELHSCKSYKCLEPWLERQKNIKLGLQDTIRKVLKCKCLRCPFIVHLNLIFMSYDQDKRWESNGEFDCQP